MTKQQFSWDERTFQFPSDADIEQLAGRIQPVIRPILQRLFRRNELIGERVERNGTVELRHRCGLDTSQMFLIDGDSSRIRSHSGCTVEQQDDEEMWKQSQHKIGEMVFRG